MGRASTAAASTLFLPAPVGLTPARRAVTAPTDPPAPSGDRPIEAVADGGAAAPAWHPDPFGRAHWRLAEAGAWADRVATWGAEWRDPPGPNSALPDLSVLAEPALALSYGAVGMEGAGRWPVFDPTGRPRGTVHVEVPGFLAGGTRRYLVLDPADRIVLQVVPRAGFSNDCDVVDWTGRPHGVFDGQTFSAIVRFVCGSLAHGQATTTDGAGNSAPFVANDVDHFTVTLTDAQGAAFASLTNHEARRGLGSFFGGQPQAGQLLPEQSWFQLDRRPDLPEPLRTFTLAFPLLYAHRVHLERAQERRMHRH